MNEGSHKAKIAFVSTMGGAPWGGSEELWSLSAISLRKLGHEIHVSVYDWPNRPSRIKELAAAGAVIHCRPIKPRLVGRTLEKLRQTLSPSPLDYASMEWLRRVKPPLLVVSQGFPWEGLQWQLACRELGISYCPIIQAHSEIWWPSDEDLPSIRHTLTDAARIFFVSRPNLELMELQCGMRLPNAEVASNPWKVDVSEPLPWPDETGGFEFACVGRLDPKAKGQDVLFQVLALPKWRERPVRLSLYGDGPCKDSLEALIHLLDLKNVSFGGQLSDVNGIWAKNHALVLPSRFEGLPLVIVEAMLCGRMVITTNVAGNAEYLSEGVNGFIAEAPTVKLLDEAMERAWARRDDWQEMGVNARRGALEVLPPDPIASFSENLLSLVVAGQLAVIH